MTTQPENNPYLVLAKIGTAKKNEDSRYNKPAWYFWNWYFSRYLTDQQVQSLINNGKSDFLVTEIPPEEEKEFKQRWINRGFDLVQLPSGRSEINFQNSEIDDIIYIGNFIFPSDVSFTGAEINHFFVADGATFFESVYFVGTNFSGKTLSIREAKIYGNLIGNDSTVNCPADFSKTEIYGTLIFHSAKFNKNVSFAHCMVHQQSSFVSATFCKEASFYKSRLNGGLFLERANFTTAVPVFLDAELSEMTFIHEVEWPTDPEKRKVLANIRNYEKLAQLMGRLERKHEQSVLVRKAQKLRFHAEPSLIAKIVNRIYGLLSGYGYSFERAWFIWLNLWMWTPLFLKPNISHLNAHWLEATAVGFSNTHSFLGLSRGPLARTYEEFLSGEIETWINFEALWFFQAIFGFLMVFFLGLTIRNRFKMN